MKTADLIGPALDWAVAKADGWKDSQLAALRKYRCDFSTDWSQGGPIIEQELNNLFKLHGRVGDPPVWCAAKHVHRDGHTALLSLTGPTPLVAAMRCYVASRLGDEVDIPEELK
jgi:hypothetical protein